MKTLPKDQHKYKLTTSVDRVPLEILKTKLKKTGTPLSPFINKICSEIIGNIFAH